MKKLPILFFLIALSLKAQSQLEYYKEPEPPSPRHHAGDLMISLSPVLVGDVPGSSGIAGGAKVQVFLGKKFSLDADIVARNGYLHLSPALIGIPVGYFGLTSDVEEQSLKSFLIYVAGLALAIEHFSFHVPVNNTMEISPYVGLLRYKLRWAPADDDGMAPATYTREQLCFATGLQLNKYYGRFILSPYADYSIGYKDHRSAVQAGIYLGMYFNRN